MKIEHEVKPETLHNLANSLRYMDKPTMAKLADDAGNELAAIRAENAELREALQNLNYLAIGAVEEGMTVVELAETLENNTANILEKFAK